MIKPSFRDNPDLQQEFSAILNSWKTGGKAIAYDSVYFNMVIEPRLQDCVKRHTGDKPDGRELTELMIDVQKYQDS